VVSPVAIVWPCPLAVDAYAAAGRDLGFPRPDGPSCAGPLMFWSGYPAARHPQLTWADGTGEDRYTAPCRLECARCHNHTYAIRAYLPPLRGL
jgi:hypothetical protein